MAGNKQKKDAAKEGLFGKALKPGQKWEKKELYTVVHWLRQGLGLILGVVWGLLSITGGAGNIGFALVSSLLVVVYYSMYLGVDDEEHGGRWPLVKEGFMPSYGIFVLSWMLTYTNVHASDL